jgi:hypothetical protein
VTTKRDIYGEVNSERDLRRVFTDIRQDVDKADSRPALTELYRRAGYLITLTYAPSWREKFGEQAEQLRQLGEREFQQTAREINHRASQIGTEANYHETWGSGHEQLPATLSLRGIRVQERELPERAHNMRVYPSRERLPVKYAHALQRVC